MHSKNSGSVEGHSENAMVVVRSKKPHLGSASWQHILKSFNMATTAEPRTRKNVLVCNNKRSTKPCGAF